MGMELLIESILNPKSDVSKHSLVKIVGSGMKFAAINTSQLHLAVGNDWGTIKDLLGGASDNLVAGAQVAQSILKTQETFIPAFAEQYTELWKGPVKPSFAVEVIVINYKGNDIRKEIMDLYRSVLPGGKTLDSSKLLPSVISKYTGSINSNLLSTPLGYNSKDGVGTVTVHIGNWFRATDLVVENVNCTFSKEVVGDENGNSTPLFATATISFRPRKAVTFNDFRGYFLTPKAQSKG